MNANLITWICTAVVFATVLSLASLGETINEKAGHLNLGVPGIMYLSAIIGYQSIRLYCLGTGATYGNFLDGFMIAIIGIFSSLLTGALLGFIYSLMCVTFKANQNVMGLVISTFGVGAGKFFSMVFGITSERLNVAANYFNAGIPGLSDLPYVGQILFSYGFMTYIIIALLIVAAIFFNKTRIGLNLRAVGESPATADSAGISVTRYRYIATMVGCGLCGVAGMTYIFTSLTGTWATNNAIEAIGWLAIALVIFISWKPLHLFWAAPLFGFLYWASTYINKAIPEIPVFTGFSRVMEMLPYLVTIIILIINSLRKKKENQPPASLGLAYFRENR